MAGNLYDDALDQLPAPPNANPYMDAAGDVAGRRTGAIRVGLDHATTTAPDRAAEVIDLSKRYNLPPAVVERNFDSIQQRARRESAPVDQILRESPALADYISNPIQAAAVQEDLGPLAAMERTVRIMGNAIRAAAAGVNQFDAGVWGVIQQIGEASGNDYLASLGWNARHESIESADFARGAQKDAGQLEKAFYSGFESLGLMAPGMLMTLLTGGSSAPMLAATGVATEGEAYGRARDEGKSIGRSSLYGATQGAIEVATEFIPAKLFLKDLVTNAGFRALVMHQIASEIPGEQIATALQDLDDWATFNPEKPFADYLAERPGRAVETLVATITAVGATTTIAGTVSRFAGDDGRVARAEESKSFFETIGNAVASMKSAEKHPASIETVIARAVEGSPIEKLYAPLDTFTTYWQGQGEDPAAMAATLTGDPKAYERAVRTGEDLAIPAGLYAARLAGTEHNAYFLNELRLGPDEMNIREAAAFKEAQAAAAQAATGEPTLTRTQEIAAGLQQGLEAAGVAPAAAAQYTSLVESAFGNMAEIAVDPNALFGQLGLAVERPALAAPAAKPETGQPASPEPRQATIPAVAGVPVAQEPGAPGEAVAREPNIVPPAVTDTAPTDESGRTLGGYAGPERRTTAGTAPGGVERRNEPVGLQPGFSPADVVAAANRMRAENPEIDAQADAMRQRALAAGRVKEPAALRAQRHGGVLDKKARGEDTTEDVDAGTQLEASRIVDSGRSPAENRVAASDPGSGKRADQRAAKHLDKVFGAVLESAQQLDPNVDAARLREEFDFRVNLYLDQIQLAADAGGDPHLILREIAKRGGLYEKDDGKGLAGELKALGAGGRFGAVAGVPGVFAKKSIGDSANKKTRGHGVDVMLQMLQDDPRFAWIESVDMLLDQIDEAARHGADKIETGVLPGTEELRDVGIRRERNWWADSWRAQDMLDDVDESLIDLAQGDTSFDVTEFNQSLFDEFDALKEPGDADTLATGEVQPRLPEAGQVREQEQATPEIAELPFSLTAPTAKPAKKKADQRTLFQGEALTRDSVRQWAADIQAVAGPDLKSFVVNLTLDGDISLDSIIVARGAQRAGLGTKVIGMLTRYADQHGARLLLTPGQRDPIHGTTSRDRLVRFYKRFGFVENKGRHKDFSVSAGMIREPNASPMREFDQALYHGSPHTFDRFSLEHVGSGEGAAAYGWGLYFAENPEVAVGYHRQLAADPTIEQLKLGSMRLSPANGFDYSRRAGESNLENIRASLAEDLLIDEVGMRAAVATGKINEHVLGVLDDKIKSYTDEWPEGVGAARQLRAELARPGAIDVKLGGSEGGVYQVEIPDEHVAKMLDWDKPASEQPENVKAALKKLGFDWSPVRIKTPRQMAAWFKTLTAQRLAAEDIGIRATLREGKKFTDDALAGDRQAADSLMFWQKQHQGLFSRGMTDPTGETIYRELQMQIVNKEGVKFDDSQRVTSLRLLEAGVPGLRYLDQDSRAKGDGTRNVVVFDDAIITLTHKDGTPVSATERREYFQIEDPPDGTTTMGGENRRGAIRFGADRQFTISLLEKADLSTFLHETGHLFLEVFGDLSDQLKAVDPATLTPRQARAVADYDALLKWLGVENRGAIATEHHEQFARGFEAYLMEGRAPSQELRPAFARFRAWLIGIYRSLKGLKVGLTDDVRRIMDRMVASEDAIARAEAEGTVAPMFTTAADAGMEPAEFELYTKTIAQASQAAREQLEVKMLAEVRREQEATWKAQQQEMNDTVRVETYDIPVYQVLAAMQRGTKPNGGPLVEGQVTPPLKLSRAIIVDRYGADRLKRLPRPYIYTREGGLDPDVVATSFGFSSGDELLRAVEQAEPMEQRIERETRRRMIEQHGSMLLDGTLQERAQGAVANEHREEIIRAELRALGKKRRAISPFVRQARQATAAEKQVEIDALAGQVADLKAQARGGAAKINAAVPPANVIRDAAKLVVARMRVREIKPAVYWQAARRSGQRAIEAAARQDFDTAIAEKQHELMSLAVFREAQTAIEDVEARVRRAQELARPSAQQRLGMAGDTYRDQVNAILDRYDFARQTGKVLDRRESLRQWVTAMKAQGFPVDLPEGVLDDARRIHYRELTIEELVGVSDALDQIVHLSRLKNRLLKIAAGREYEATRDALVSSIREHNKAVPRALETRPEDQKWKTIAAGFASHLKIATIARVMDGGIENGPMYQTFIRPLHEASNDEMLKQETLARTFTKLYTDHYTPAEIGKFGDRLYISAIKGSLSKEARLAVALNWGNEGGRERLLNDPTREWSQSQVQAVLDTLDERDWKFVRGYWSVINSLWDEIVALDKRTTGIAPEKVNGVPVHTAYGTFEGAYYPIVYDAGRGARAKAIDDENSVIGSASHAATGRGHTKARLQHTDLALRLDLGVGISHVEKVIHDLTHREVVSDLARLLRDKKVSTAFYDTRGQAFHDQLQETLTDIARGPAPVRGVDAAFRWLRNRTTLALLGLNVWTSLQQPLGLFNGAQRVGAKWVARGLYRWVRDAATMQGTVEWIWSVSPTMKARGAGSLNQDLSDLRASLRQPGGWFDRMVRSASGNRVSTETIASAFTWHIGRMQRIADVPTWLGAYEKAHANGADEKAAIALADQAVIDSQGGAAIKDLASIQRGSEAAKMFMLFYSYGSTVMNSAYAAGATKNYRKPADVAKLLGDLSLLYIVPAMGTVALGFAVGKGGAGEDNEEWGDWAIDVARESLSSFLNGFIGVRELTGLTREDGPRGYAGPAGTRLLQLIYNAKQQVEQGELDDAAYKALVDLAGVIFGLPLGQVQKTVDGVRALEEGRTTNPAAVLVGAPQ